MALNWVEEAQLRNFKVGSIVYTWCDFCTPAKNKYLLVASLEPNFLILVINSVINQFYISNGLDRFHVLISLEDHPFLEHDSHASCVEAIESFDVSFMRAEVLENYKKFHRGHLSTRCLKDVFDAVVEQDIMRQGQKDEIVASIKAQLCMSLFN